MYDMRTFYDVVSHIRFILPISSIHLFHSVNVCLLGGVGASGAAMYLAPAVMIFVAGGICIANVPYAMYKEQELKKIPTLRSMNNKLREDANHLKENVDMLVQEMNILEPEADRAAKVEGKLRKAADKQHVNVDKLVNLVHENGQVLVEMRVSEHISRFIACGCVLHLTNFDAMRYLESTI